MEVSDAEAVEIESNEICFVFIVRLNSAFKLASSSQRYILLFFLKAVQSFITIE